METVQIDRVVTSDFEKLRLPSTLHAYIQNTANKEVLYTDSFFGPSSPEAAMKQVCTEVLEKLDSQSHMLIIPLFDKKELSLTRFLVNSLITHIQHTASKESTNRDTTTLSADVTSWNENIFRPLLQLLIDQTVHNVSPSERSLISK